MKIENTYGLIFRSKSGHGKLHMEPWNNLCADLSQGMANSQQKFEEKEKLEKPLNHNEL